MVPFQVHAANPAINPIKRNHVGLAVEDFSPKLRKGETRLAELMAVEARVARLIEADELVGAAVKTAQAIEIKRVPVGLPFGNEVCDRLRGLRGRRPGRLPG